MYFSLWQQDLGLVINSKIQNYACWKPANGSVFMQSSAKAINAGLGSLSARNAAVDLAHDICSDYTCLFLDSVVACSGGYLLIYTRFR